MNDPAPDPASARLKPAIVPLPTILRDPSFTRVGADVSFATVIGGDLDIALMARQAIYRDVLMGKDEQPEGMSTAKTLVEVARLRMPAQSAMLMAFHIFGSCAGAGLLDLENFDENILVIRAAIIAADEEEAK